MIQYRKLGLFIITLTFFIACNTEEKKTEKKEQTNTFTISGEIKGLGNNNLYFRMPDETQEKKFRYDSIIVKNDKFSFTEKIDQIKLLKFWVKIKSIEKSVPGANGYFPSLSNNLNLFIFPGADVKVSGEILDFVNAYPSGDPANDDLAKLHREIYPILNKVVNLKIESVSEKDKNKSKEIRNIIKDELEKVDEIKIDFINKNPSSIASLWYVSDMMMRNQLSNEEAIAIFNKLDKKLNDNPFYKDIEIRIEGIKATKEGQMVPEIKTTSTVDGKEFDLSSYRGKYVLIDFWGSWCGPCVAEMPKVNEYAKKYKGKLEILGINSGDSKKKLTDFLNEHNYKWQQILSARGESTDNFVLKFNVAGFPTKFIIDPEGKILKRFVGNSEEAFIFLDELLK